MSADEFQRETRYEFAMHQVRRMLDIGLISEDEFREIEGRFRARYHPITGGLLVETDLLCMRGRVINGRGKEGSDHEENQPSGAGRPGA
mgnify:CR=1 FL=1